MPPCYHGGAGGRHRTVAAPWTAVALEAGPANAISSCTIAWILPVPHETEAMTEPMMQQANQSVAEGKAAKKRRYQELLQSHDWVCPSCHRTEPTLRYSNPNTRKCKDCTRFGNLLLNTKSETKQAFRPTFSLDAFQGWCDKQGRSCAYCGIAEADVRALNLLNRKKLRVEALGVDRIDNSQGYTFANMVLCCLGCNEVKGDGFTSADMKILGPAIRSVWDGRRLQTPTPLTKIDSDFPEPPHMLLRAVRAARHSAAAMWRRMTGGSGHQN
jgi:hypothetical protein